MKFNKKEMKYREQASNERIMGFPGQEIKIIGTEEITQLNKILWS